MIVFTAILFGNWDVVSLLLMVALTVAMCQLGLRHERVNASRGRSEIRWDSFVYGAVAGVTPCVAIIVDVASRQDRSAVPRFAWTLLGVYGLFFVLFPANLLARFLKVGPWADRDFPGSGAHFGERVFMALGFASKFAMCWTVVIGAATG